jgi:hypothetical protein
MKSKKVKIVPNTTENDKEIVSGRSPIYLLP